MWTLLISVIEYGAGIGDAEPIYRIVMALEAELRKPKRGVRLYFRVSADDQNSVEYMSVQRRHQVDFEWFTSDLVKTYSFRVPLNIAR